MIIAINVARSIRKFRILTAVYIDEVFRLPKTRTQPSPIPRDPPVIIHTGLTIGFRIHPSSGIILIRNPMVAPTNIPRAVFGNLRIKLISRTRIPFAISYAIEIQ
jgi:hypothetical protein